METGQVQCPEPNGFFPDAKRCDMFVECRDGVGTAQTCPDGLIVNEEAAKYRNPCEYPVDSDCGARTLPRQLFLFLTFLKKINSFTINLII